VRGRLPVSGEARLAGALDACGTQLVAATSGLFTGSRVLDQILKGPGFLEADAYSDITFWSDELTRVPTGWRAIGWLRVKGVEHELACELALGHAARRIGQLPRLCAVSHWVLDSTWITGSRIPGLSRRVAMTSSVVLEPAE
jgi:polyisoprenoid-binding protein YceI